PPARPPPPAAPPRRGQSPMPGGISTTGHPPRLPPPGPSPEVGFRPIRGGCGKRRKKGWAIWEFEVILTRSAALMARWGWPGQGRETVARLAAQAGRHARGEEPWHGRGSVLRRVGCRSCPTRGAA